MQAALESYKLHMDWVVLGERTACLLNFPWSVCHEELEQIKADALAARRAAEDPSGAARRLGHAVAPGRFAALGCYT